MGVVVSAATFVVVHISSKNANINSHHLSINFNEFKSFYEINAKRWRCDFCNVVFRSFRGDFVFNFKGIDKFRYLYWKKLKKKQEIQEEQCENMRFVIEELRADIDKFKKGEL